MDRGGDRGWGGENIELSMKNIMCGGEIWGVPCSRCYHFAASRKPEYHGGRVRASQTNNIVTVAKSFLDDDQFAEFLRGRRSWSADLADKWAVGENKKLLKDLKCDRDYEWIRDHLMDPTIESLSAKTHIAVELMFGEQCIKVEGMDIFRLVPCQRSQPFFEQIRFTKRFELRWGRQKCFDVGWSPPRLNGCHFSEGHQKFHYSILTQQLSCPGLGTCLTFDPLHLTFTFIKCSENDPNQRLHFKTVFHPDSIP